MGVTADEDTRFPGIHGQDKLIRHINESIFIQPATEIAGGLLGAL